jgi:hypothetical protein
VFRSELGSESAYTFEASNVKQAASGASSRISHDDFARLVIDI